MKKMFLLIMLGLSSFSAFAAKPTCHSSNGGYCEYTGKISRIYVNNSNQILVYFDTPFDVGEWDKAGFTASQTAAAIILIDEKPSYAKLFYSTALAAQVSKREVNFQMRNVVNGYLKADRIWLSE